jgi:predicted house-cleaning noncanonical NTP pyrophosphatase (MazG superfamily)
VGYPDVSAKEEEVGGRMTRYDKLVRDKIPEYIRSKGGTPVAHIAAGTEYWQKLKEKLSEEVAEFGRDENIEELADILEVIDAIAEFKKFSQEAIGQERTRKANERGRFRERIILEES